MNPTPTDVTKEKLFDEFNTVISETEQLLKSVATASGDKAGALKADVERRLTAAGARLEEIRLQALGQAKQAAQATDDYVQANPWQSIGIAAALAAATGLVAGLLIARR
jgi:ElaB/YqjD/DUF883 family membrane-anchored ribosome-binding protein